MPAQLSTPDGARHAPAVIVIMEAFGLLPHIERIADRLAGEGFAALAPDFYYRMAPDNTAGYDQLERAMSLMQSVGDDGFISDMRAALGFLGRKPEVASSRIAVTGFCMGGRLSFLAAAELSDAIAAAAPFYGGGIGSLMSRAGRIECPLHLFFGADDTYIPESEVRAIDIGLRELGKTYRIDVYPGAGHGFMCEDRPGYAAEAAADAWVKLTSFLRAELAEA